ncbi:hypothetical protein [Halopelagius longus]|uniref:Uncharacterized protein n=1 Tax=Halopelagius longus TaxID=1236180 RepID=A0A1H1FBB3_9EURY|nr:hypothetical protein [Halopelagius longus]RDI70183.1 hypothetical protein DWB78_16330 [Halopelagius longus]SDQ98241.1 hypothetical protein SAMN05216278_3118 [Halopelagius longus]
MSVQRLRQPEYTGKNRCTPCTIVNTAIAIFISVLASIISPVLGPTVFLASMLTIYLRGYLVPGTPKLTKRYVPDGVLRWFDKEAPNRSSDTEVRVNPEAVLLECNAVEPTEDGTDLELSSSFEQSWRSGMQSVTNPGINEIRSTISGVNNHLNFEQSGDSVIAHKNGEVVGQWDSTAAITADVAAANELVQRSPSWKKMTFAEKARILMSLRVFLEKCPACEGDIRLEDDVVESCCRSYDVIAASCTACDSQLFETEWNEELEATA